MLHEGSGARASEAIGVVLKVEGGTGPAHEPHGAPAAHILTRRGETKVVPLEDIEVGKLWPV